MSNLIRVRLLGAGMIINMLICIQNMKAIIALVAGRL